MGLTKEGFIRRSYDDILNDKIALARELFGEDIETGSLTPLGKFLRINAYDQALAEEEIEAVYYARFPNTAIGQSLDRLVVFAGLKRNPAIAACYTVEITGTPGYTVPAGFLVGTEGGLTYYTTAPAEIGADGKSEAEAVCTQTGVLGSVPADAISKVINPNAEITGCQGVLCVTAGAEEESDPELRKRFAAAVRGSGSCNENAIRAALLRIPTVSFAAVIANDTCYPDSEGRPPHSFQCYLYGGDGKQREIAEAIFEKKPIGVRTVGDISVEVTDTSGTTREIWYSRAGQINVMVRVRARVTEVFQKDGAEQIRENVTAHINGMGIGSSLILSTVYGHIYAVTGVTEVTELTVSTDGENFSYQNVAAAVYQAVICTDVAVEVTGGG